MLKKLKIKNSLTEQYSSRLIKVIKTDKDKYETCDEYKCLWPRLKLCVKDRYKKMRHKKTD